MRDNATREKMQGLLVRGFQGTATRLFVPKLTESSGLPPLTGDPWREQVLRGKKWTLPLFTQL
jgi:hypothetical protein